MKTLTPDDDSEIPCLQAQLKPVEHCLGRSVGTPSVFVMMLVVVMAPYPATLPVIFTAYVDILPDKTDSQCIYGCACAHDGVHRDESQRAL